MTGPTPQINDLLLGPAGPNMDGPLSGGVPGTVDDGPLFANLLVGSMEGQPLTQNVLGLQQGTSGDDYDTQDGSRLPHPLVESDVYLLNTMTLPTGVDDSEELPGTIDEIDTELSTPGEVLSKRSTVLNLLHLPQRSERQSLPMVVAPLIDNLSVMVNQAVDKLDSPPGLLPEAEVIRNQSLKEILTGNQVKIEPGRYRVLESEVSKGQLNLTVVSSEPSSEQIKLSLPLKTLFREGSFSPGRTVLSGLAPVEPSLMEGPALEDYISKLKLTSLEVEAEVESSAPTDAKQSILRLFAGVGDRQLMMLSHLDENGLIGRRKAKLSLIDRVEGGSVDTVEALLDPQPEAEGPAGRSAARPWNDALLNRLHPFAGKSDQELTMLSPATDTPGENVNTVTMNDLIGPDAKIERSSLDDEGLKTRSPRLSLPEDVRTTLKPGGQTVTLRIEPEHLGPARLRLAMHNNVLKAVVTVDSTQAKLVVEGSLDQLTNQLSKADIQVDRIEVALNSDSHHESFLHRRPRRQAPLKSRRGIDGAGAVVTLAGAEDRYDTHHRVGTCGVNLLA